MDEETQYDLNNLILQPAASSVKSDLPSRCEEHTLRARFIRDYSLKHSRRNELLGKLIRVRGGPGFFLPYSRARSKREGQKEDEIIRKLLQQ